MTTLHPEAPFYDLYDKNKKYAKILALPGRGAQSREVNEMQSMLYDYMGRLGNSLLSNGSVVEDCVCTVQDGVAHITAGKIYYDGLIRLVDESAVTLDMSSSEVIGVKLNTSIVTESTDSSLRDPALGYENYGSEGAYREKGELVFAHNDDAATTVFRFENGELVKTTEVDDLDQVVEILARRTFDESGNYKVSGLELRERGEVRDNNILISLTEGKAYIQGYEVIKPATSSIAISKALTTRQIVNEPKMYSTGTTMYKFNNQPVESVALVSAIVQKTASITRGNIAGGIDYLPLSPVYDIVSIVQGATTYEKGVDYQLTNDGVDWSLTGIEPSSGSTYTCTYRYTKTMELGTDYEIATQDGLQYVKTLAGDLPVNGSTMNFTYNFFLYRKDLVLLDSTGTAKVVQGKPDVSRLVETPLNQDETKLVLGSIMVYPNSADVDVVNVNTTRLSMNDLFKLSRRVTDIEYNQAITDLDREAEAGEDATLLKGIYTDGFVGVTKADLTHELYNCTIDLDTNEVTLPSTVNVAAVAPNLSTYDTNIGVYGKVMMAPFSNVIAFSQNKATGSMLVNPYAVYNPFCLVQLNPDVDNWIDSSKAIINKQETSVVSLRKWWYHRGDRWAQAERARWLALTGADNGSITSASTTTTSDEIVFDEAILYMRQRSVEASGQNFLAGSDNLKCYFNETLIPLTPTGTTLAGTQAGTVKVKSDGTFTASFNVPPNVPCGSVKVEFKNDLGEGSAVYQASGRKQVIEETVLTTTVRVNSYDPLAQSFSFGNDTVLTRAGLYFASKDTNKAIVVEIRNMVNGYPGPVVYATSVIPAANVNVSAKGTVATVFDFDQPVYCDANVSYCMCVLSDSNLYSAFIATLGEKDVNTGVYVTAQPYSTGVLFSSSNASTWTAHQTSDLKFDLYKAHYTGTGTVVFNDVSGLTISRLLLAANVVDYLSAGIEWFYQIDNQGTWMPIETYVDRELSALGTKVSLKAELSVAYSTSPIMAKNFINLISFLEGTEAVYVSREVIMDDDFSNVNVSAELCLPSGTAVHAYYQNSDIGATWNELLTPTIKVVDEEFSKYSWTATLGAPANNYRVMIKLTTSNPLVRPRARKLINILK